MFTTFPQEGSMPKNKGDILDTKRLGYAWRMTEECVITSGHSAVANTLIRGLSRTDKCYVQSQCAPSAPSEIPPHQSDNRYYVQTPDGSFIEDSIQEQQQPQENATTGSVQTRFRGVREVSQKGIHKVLIYEIPDSSLAYVFAFKGKTSMPDICTYRCMQCKKVNKYTTVLVHGDDFLEDPTRLRHQCIPIKRTKDKATRMSYEVISLLQALGKFIKELQCLQQIRRDEDASLLPTVKYFLDVIDRIENMEWGDINKKLSVLAYYHGRGYECRRSALSRAVKRNIREVDMDNIPTQLKLLRDGSPFLQVQQPLMHIYMSQDIRAVENGLHALIGDGIHQLNPRSKRGSDVRIEEGQVYTIHGVCQGGFEVRCRDLPLNLGKSHFRFRYCLL
ncbi:unnamed protein product [Cylicostephanus goldi]|uniref:Uncharacterized protein n=1 Tax=Cylicostephanus goldi TaxID=71465 RepID=A0A3P7QCP0_CYLGO|nr:unnamed protein product [Cylicostephanus goldi]